MSGCLVPDEPQVQVGSISAPFREGLKPREPSTLGWRGGDSGQALDVCEHIWHLWPVEDGVAIRVEGQSVYGVFVPRRPRRVTAKDYRSAYDHRARYFSDPAMMTGRDTALTQFKIANVVDRLPLSSTSRVLDIGPGDGALFRLIAHRVAACVGVDPSEHAVAKLSRTFHDCPNVTFVVGTCTDLPPADEPFELIVINSVVHMLEGDDEVRETLASIARLSAPSGTVYVGEVPFRSERADGLVTQLRTQVAHVGARRAARAVFEMYVRPVLRGEPLLVEPVGRTLDYTPDAFAALVREAGFGVEVLPHLEPRGVSTTRKDYLLTRLP